jgi:hypothetical protein
MVLVWMAKTKLRLLLLGRINSKLQLNSLTKAWATCHPPMPPLVESGITSKGKSQLGSPWVSWGPPPAIPISPIKKTTKAQKLPHATGAAKEIVKQAPASPYFISTRSKPHSKKSSTPRNLQGNLPLTWKPNSVSGEQASLEMWFVGSFVLSLSLRLSLVLIPAFTSMIFWTNGALHSSFLCLLFIRLIIFCIIVFVLFVDAFEKLFLHCAFLRRLSTNSSLSKLSKISWRSRS